MKNIIIGFLFLCLAVSEACAGGFSNSGGGFSASGQSFGGEPQRRTSNVSADRAKKARYSEMENNPAVRFSRSFIKNSGDERKARNLLFLEEIANYKLNDEELSDDFNAVEDSREYDEKLKKALKKLTNRKMKDSKNRKVMEILDDAGDRLYNLLAD